MRTLHGGGHYIESCRSCGSVISQCRCMDPGKEQRWGTCDACRAKAAAPQTTEPTPPSAPEKNAAGNIVCRFRETFDWDTERPQPGDMFYITFAAGHCSEHEPPCERHLQVVCPDGSWWDIDGRANNCTLKDDKAHRCWVRHGDPPKVTVDKRGVTCGAGAGSIQTAKYHGFLKDGVFIP